MKTNKSNIKGYPRCKFMKLDKFAVVVNDFSEAHVCLVFDNYADTQRHIKENWGDVVNCECSDPDATVYIYDLSKGYYLAKKIEDLPGYEEGEDYEGDLEYCYCDRLPLITEGENACIGIPFEQNVFQFECIKKDLGL